MHDAQWFCLVFLKAFPESGNRNGSNGRMSQPQSGWPAGRVSRAKSLGRLSFTPEAISLTPCASVVASHHARLHELLDLSFQVLFVLSKRDAGRDHDSLPCSCWRTVSLNDDRGRWRLIASDDSP